MRKISIVLICIALASVPAGCGNPNATVGSAESTTQEQTQAPYVDAGPTTQETQQQTQASSALAGIQDCASKWNPRTQPAYSPATRVLVFKWPTGECGIEVSDSGTIDDALSLMMYRSGGYRSAAGGISPANLSALVAQAASESNAVIADDGSITPDEGGTIATVSVSPAYG